MAQRLPIGIQTFRTIREDGYYYVDKTGYIARLLAEGTHYFLSRPRRFGKSLLLDTLKEVFAGSEELFRGLAIHSDWDWTVRYPVVRLSFGSGNFNEAGFVEPNVNDQLAAIEQDHDIESRSATTGQRFAALLRALHRRTGQRVVVLIDEYDKPILDALGVPDAAKANRDFLRGLYGTIKDADADVRFAFLTGVSKFTKVSLFSGLNNLADITLEPRYSSICGYTQRDLDGVFEAELDGLDRDEIRDWYNGYGWLGTEKVYNPFDILLLLRNRRFGPYWFETGTPTFLANVLLDRGVSPISLDGMRTSEEMLGTFDVDRIEPEALLFQTGYLTITGTESRGGSVRHRLGFPNREVCQSLNESLLGHLTQDPNRGDNADRLYDLLAAGDIAGLESLFRAFFASIPYEWYTNNRIASFEGYYAGVVYAYLAATLGPAVTVEDSSSRGRADLAVRAGGRVYVLEFKVVEQAGAGSAMAQLRERGYADKYRAAGMPAHLVGVEFSSAARNVVAFEAEVA